MTTNGPYQSERVRHWLSKATHEQPINAGGRRVLEILEWDRAESKTRNGLRRRSGSARVPVNDAEQSRNLERLTVCGLSRAVSSRRSAR